jgi:hypothetical protein
MAEKSTPDDGPREEDLTLYSTGACHLCEVAEAMLAPWVQRGLLVCVEDISTSDALFARYGERIPVLRRRDTGAELDWPFDAARLAAFLDQVRFVPPG